MVSIQVLGGHRGFLGERCEDPSRAARRTGPSDERAVSKAREALQLFVSL